MTKVLLTVALASRLIRQHEVLCFHIPPTRVLGTLNRASPGSEPFLHQQVSSLFEDGSKIKDRHISVSDMVKSLFRNDIYTKELIEEYFDRYIEYIDTSMYKSICGKDGLLRKFEQGSSNKIFFSCDDSTKVDLVDMMVSFDKMNHNKTKVCLLYKNHYNHDSSSINEGENNHNDLVETSTVGMTVMNIENGKITTLFNVKRALGGDFIPSNREDYEESTNVILNSHDKHFLKNISKDNEEKAELIITEFFDTRNKFDSKKIMDFMDNDCTLECVFANDEVFHLRKDYASLSTYFQKLKSSSYPSSTSLIIDDIFVSTINPNQNEVKIGVEWHIELNGEILRFQRGCSMYTVNVDDSLITKGIDIMESTKEEDSDAEKARNILSPWWQNKIRDYGIGRFVADSMVKLSLPAVVSQDSSILSNFLALNKVKKEMTYGTHKSQTVDLFFPDDPSKIKGVVFFMHGGAWGSGEKWMYRNSALPFLDMGMIVGIVGYRTYPDGDIDDQVDDLESALQTFKANFPQYSKLADEEWLGTSLVGHSSGAHISMLSILRQLERKHEKTLNIDAFISLAGVFSITDHFHHEIGRGVDEISPMKPACGNTRESFDYFSPTERFQKVRSLRKSSSLPRMLFVHGLEDDTVPFTSTQKLVSAIKQTGIDVNCTEYYLPNVEHAEVIIDVMTGGQSRDIVQQWLE